MCSPAWVFGFDPPLRCEDYVDFSCWTLYRQYWRFRLWNGFNGAFVSSHMFVKPPCVCSCLVHVVSNWCDLVSVGLLLWDESFASGLVDSICTAIGVSRKTYCSHPVSQMVAVLTVSCTVCLVFRDFRAAYIKHNWASLLQRFHWNGAMTVGPLEACRYWSRFIIWHWLFTYKINSNKVPFQVECLDFIEPMLTLALKIRSH